MQFPANRVGFINMRNYDDSLFAGKLCYLQNDSPALWLRPPDGWQHSKKLVVYLHGNAATLRSCHSLLRKVRDKFKCHVMALEFASYGTTKQSLLTVDSFITELRRSFEFIHTDLKFEWADITMLAFCMGCFPAFKLAEILPPLGSLIAVAPLSSVINYFTQGSSVPIMSKMTCPDFFDSVKSAKSITCPTLIVNGRLDRTADIGHSAALFSALATTNKDMVRYSQKHIMKWDVSVIPAMQRFLERSGVVLTCEQKQKTLEPNDKRADNGDDKDTEDDEIPYNSSVFAPRHGPPNSTMIQHYGFWVMYLVVFLFVIFRFGVFCVCE